jgi:hypothetical protein
MTVCEAGVKGYAKKGQLCYVCANEIMRSQQHIYYSGHRSDGKEGHIFLHMECATILSMRLIHDVMLDDNANRVVHTLRDVRNVFQLQREEE